MSSLQSWWSEFSHFSLCELRGLSQFVIEREPGKPGFAINSMEVDQFFAFQKVYLQKVQSIIRNIWHRGCILIIKKFKYLRTNAEQKESFENNKGFAGKRKFTMKGFKTGQEDLTLRRYIES